MGFLNSLLGFQGDDEGSDDQVGLMGALNRAIGGRPAIPTVPGFGTQMGNILTDQDQMMMPQAGGGSTRGGLLSMDGFLGGTDAQGTWKGWGMPALGAAQTIMGAMDNKKKMAMANKAFKENVRQFDMNYGAQRQATNTQLEDRQRARVASNSGYESVDSYMNRNRVV